MSIYLSNNNKRMNDKILFDGVSTQGSKRGKYHGGAEYAKYILLEAINRGYVFDVVFNTSMFTDPEITNALDKAKNVQVYNVNNKEGVYSLIRNNSYKSFFSALPAKYSDYNEKTPLYGVVHGLRSIELPWDKYRYKYEPNLKNRLVAYTVTNVPFLQRYLKKKHIQKTKKLISIPNASFITVSNHTKCSLLFHYPEVFKNKSIQVFYSPFHVESIAKKTPKENYFLMVIGGRFEKNVYRAVKAFDTLFSKGLLPNMRVKITGCGSQPYWSEIKSIDRFDLLPYVSVEELNSLYANAFCFVYPSLNEGFGYPPVLAMSYGTPVVASSSTSIPEVCGPAACYFSPTNIDDLCNRLLRVFSDNTYRDHLSDIGLRRVEELQTLQSEKISGFLDSIFEI